MRTSTQQARALVAGFYGGATAGSGERMQQQDIIVEERMLSLLEDGSGSPNQQEALVCFVFDSLWFALFYLLLHVAFSFYLFKHMF